MGKTCQETVSNAFLTRNFDQIDAFRCVNLLFKDCLKERANLELLLNNGDTRFAFWVADLLDSPMRGLGAAQVATVNPNFDC
jgi:hypothetical protein